MTHTLRLIGLLAVMLLTAVFIISLVPDPVVGSVEESNEYQATTTIATSVPSLRLIKTGSGALGSVVITGAQAGVINLYNATTSNVNLRTGQVPTSTILLAQFPASAAAGTYTFDVVFTAGLLLETSASPLAPTSTITWR